MTLENFTMKLKLYTLILGLMLNGYAMILKRESKQDWKITLEKYVVNRQDLFR